MLFKEFFHKAQLSLDGTTSRHRKPMYSTDIDRHYRRKSLNMVPQYVQADLNKNHKIEKLKKMPANSGMKFVCNPQDLGYIKSTFLKGKDPVKGEMKMLGGKMGIKLYFDNNKNQWMIEK